MSENTLEISKEYSFSNSISLGWQILKDNYWPLVLSCFVAMVIIGVGGTIAGLVPFGSAVFSIFVTTPLSVGLWWWTVLASRGEKPTVNKIFSVFSDKYLTVVGISFVIVIIFYALMFGAIFVGGLIAGVSILAILTASEQASAGDFESIALGALLVPVIFATIIGTLLGLFSYARLAWAPLIAMDPEEKATNFGECMGRSWNMTAGNWFSIFFLFVFLSIVMFVSFLLLCVGLFFLGIPLYVAAAASAYILLSANDDVE